MMAVSNSIMLSPCISAIAERTLTRHAPYRDAAGACHYYNANVGSCTTTKLQAAHQLFCPCEHIPGQLISMLDMPANVAQSAASLLMPAVSCRPGQDIKLG